VLRSLSQFVLELLINVIVLILSLLRIKALVLVLSYCCHTFVVVENKSVGVGVVILLSSSLHC
jgi:hypothetical protein